MWETLPSWFWVFYYLFLLVTFGTAISRLLQNKQKQTAMVVITITFLLPIISLTNSIGRADGMNEFEHLFSQLQLGAAWSIFTVAGYIFLFSWWAFIVVTKVHRRKAV
ncbi:hypothetical protein [Bacillus sp. KH172YL63]|uniref:hypothetical protein n=1 Tax=Bacillus sp. KH172YL63 TaxID=2709784 RepID=UPI0013E50CDB|nr:hypothetical protein [Bacillus sp. KH172YL63]BCB05128.1 hypothetical protein KH172YL63_32610 [Bacillus sp. KH172YL63]